MSYCLYITRAASWSRNTGKEISAQEWLALVGKDLELRAVAENGPYFVSWCPEQHGTPQSWFDWDGGNVYTSNPERAVIAKMLQLAKGLDAHVLGEDDELYDAQGAVLPDGLAASCTQRGRWRTALQALGTWCFFNARRLWPGRKVTSARHLSAHAPRKK